MSQCVPEIMGAFSKTGEDQKKAEKEAQQNLKILETGLEGKRFFGGETIGFVDIVAGWIGVWARLVEEIAGVNLIDETTMPLLNAWFQSFLSVPVVKECLPPWEKLLEHNKEFQRVLVSGSST